jgi:hypothetical protein
MRQRKFISWQLGSKERKEGLETPNPLEGHVPNYLTSSK